jgi:two-component system, LuxR family, sensor kinase FixL
MKPTPKLASSKTALRKIGEAEARINAILNTAVDGIITIDETGIIESYNPAAARIFGYPEEQVLHQNIRMLMPHGYAERHDGYLRHYLKTGEKRIIGIGREVTGQRADGSQFPMELAVSENWIGKRRTFTGIVRDISERQRLQKAIVDASEMERKQIGQDLHDTVSQQLAGLTMLSSVLQKKISQLPTDIAATLTADADRIADLAATALKQVKSISHGLYPVELERNGLSTALHQLANQQDALFQISCTYESSLGDSDIDMHTAVHLYRIAQEAISNAIKHAHPSHIHVQFKRVRNAIRLSITDDGCGMPQQLPERKGLGLAIMQYRATMIGGEFALKAARGSGTTVTCTLPDDTFHQTD